MIKRFQGMQIYTDSDTESKDQKKDKTPLLLTNITNPKLLLKEHPDQ
jgi:hypothetical protein